MKFKENIKVLVIAASRGIFRKPQNCKSTLDSRAIKNAACQQVLHFPMMAAGTFLHVN